jgi:hypothetical protein
VQYFYVFHLCIPKKKEIPGTRRLQSEATYSHLGGKKMLNTYYWNVKNLKKWREERVDSNWSNMNEDLLYKKIIVVQM